MMPAYMKNGEQKLSSPTQKVNDVLVFNPYTAHGTVMLQNSLLCWGDKEAVADEIKFQFQVEEITVREGELNRGNFRSNCGKDVVKVKKNSALKVKEVIANQFVADGDCKFLLDVRKMLMEKVGKLEFRMHCWSVSY